MRSEGALVRGALAAAEAKAGEGDTEECERDGFRHRCSRKRRPKLTGVELWTRSLWIKTTARFPRRDERNLWNSGCSCSDTDEISAEIEIRFGSVERRNRVTTGIKLHRTDQVKEPSPTGR